jgi:hypothetical protein
MDVTIFPDPSLRVNGNTGYSLKEGRGGHTAIAGRTPAIA